MITFYATIDGFVDLQDNTVDAHLTPNLFLDVNNWGW